MTFIFLSILALIIIYFYLTRKFKWVNGKTTHALYYGKYTAFVSAENTTSVDVEVFYPPAKMIYGHYGAKSVRQAKKIAEDKILECEQREYLS